MVRSSDRGAIASSIGRLAIDVGVDAHMVRGRGRGDVGDERGGLAAAWP